MSEKKTTRRNFLSASAGFLALSAGRPSVASAQRRILGANDRINVGVIGTGGRANGLMRTVKARIEMKGDARIVATSDIYAKRKEAGRQTAGIDAKDVHHDYRDLLARPDIDAVIIATPDHWHSVMATDAIKAGKDVYLEKPMTLTVEEARDLSRTVKQSDRVLQVGSQYTSNQLYRKAREIVQDGWIGPVLWAQATYSRNSIWGEWNYEIDPGVTAEEVGWKNFLGSAPNRPFDPDRYFRWRKYWDYSGGIATDLFYHYLSPLRQIMGIEFPTRVTGSGGIYVHKDREVPDTYSTTIEYAGDYCTMSASMANAAANQYFGMAIYGHEGTITFDRNLVIVEPEWQFRDKFIEKTGAEKMYVEIPPHDMQKEHMDNFLDCVRSRQQPVFNAEFGYKIMTAIKLGVDSYRQGKVMVWDAERERVTDRAPARPGYPGDGMNHEEPRRRS